MKKGLLFLVLCLLCSAGFAQLQVKPEWTKVLSDSPGTFKTQLISSSENSIKVNVQVPGFYTTTVKTPNGEAYVITVPKSVSTAKAGEPDMPMTGIPVMIGDKAQMNVRVIDAQYMDFEGIEVAPSKGDFSRQIDPETVPYTYGECYHQDAFFPTKNLGLYEPYIIRDFRGQNMVVYPFAYNPVTKTLRVYYDMTVEMYKVNDKGSNIIESRRSNEVKMDPDFKSIYQRHFINYEAGMAKYTPLDEEGDLLIICYDSYISSMTDFVNWKKTRGINTTIVGTSTAGSTYSAIQTYIQNQYNANNNLTHVLLVGDVAQIPGYTYSGASGYEGKGDNSYGQIVGNDIYNDVFIGRFSASSTTRVTTQANRVIAYERDLNTSDTWLKIAEGISRKENGAGHNNEDDYQHMDNIRTDLLNYGYTTVYQRYANLSGYDGSSSTISSDINSGVGIINYANHGQETAWGANSSGYIYYANSHVNALTNNNKLPFIWSVACLVGKYDHSSDCFAEAWMNATNGSNPTGAIGALMSYISQPWIPPMWAQDECVDILIDSYSSNIKHTWGGTSINGLMGIFDHYSTSTAQAVGTYQAWILYGDPSMMLRTKTPTAMTVTHTGTIAPSDNTYSVTVSDGNGALATITDTNHNILGKATVSNGTATISITGTLTVGTELTLCVFGFNKVTYLGTISVVGGTQYTIAASASPTAGGTVSGAGKYYENTQCTLTATPNTGYTFTNWKKGNTVVSTNATYSFTVTSSTAGTYTATFTAIPQYTISVSANPTAGGTVSGGGTFYENTQCTLTATAKTHYEFTNWTKNGTQVSTSPTYTFTVTASGTYTANFTALQPHTVTCNAVENGSISASPTTAYKGETVTLTASAASGYFFSAWDVRDANNNPVAVINNTFTMPDTNVTVNATFISGCTVTVADVEHGTVTATPTTAIPGTTINLTATPETDYNLSSWLVYKTGDVRNTVTCNGNSFVLPAFDVTVVGIFKKNKEEEVAIGSGTSSDSYLPTYAYYKYTLTEQIFTASEVGQAGIITKIAFKVSNNKSATRTLDVYLKHTTKSTFTSTTGWETLSSSYKVYSGSVTFQASGWTTITLDTPFEYDGTSNLLLGVDDNTGSYVSSSSNSPTFYVYSTNANRALRIYSDGTNYNPASPTSYSGTYVTSNNQVTFTMRVSGNDEASLTVSPNALSDFSYVEGNGPSATQNLAVIGVDLSDDIIVTAPEHFEISDEENGSYGSTLTLAASSKGSRESITYDFEDGTTQGWTLLKGTTGNSPNNWMHVNDYVRPAFATSNYGHNSSSGWMLSESYISTTTEGSGTAVTPDNYFVSPQVNLGGSITFYVTDGNDDYGEEHFALLVSTTGNTNVGDFTQIQEWTLSFKGGKNGGTRTFTNGTWYEYTVDLSAYSGTGYLAIRHFNCSDQWILGLDDITIVTPASSVTPVDPTVDLLTANVYVRMKAGLSYGNYTNETLTVATGDVTSNVSLNGEVEQGDVTYYNITVAANPSEGGTVTGANNYAEGAMVTLTATANEGYTFTNWTKNGTQVSTNAEYTFTATEAAEYVANFTLNTYTITALVNPENAGTVTGAGTYSHGEGVILTATANVGYTFVNWTENDVVVCVNPTCVSNATANRTLVANFTLNTYTVTATADPTVGGSITGNGDYSHGSSATLTATPADGYYFINWTKDGVEIGTEETLTLTVTEALSVVAHFGVSNTQVISLNSSYNWFSTYIYLDGAEGLTTLKEALGSNSTQIKAKNGYTNYSNGGWHGSLNSYDIRQMYQIENINAADITLTGTIVNPADHPLTLEKGWNWIGYPVTQAMDLNSALNDLNASEEDVIKSRTGFSTYVEGYGWWGTLYTLNPGEGYKYNSMADSKITFAYPSNSRIETRANITTEGNHWIPSEAFANTINVMATLPANSAVNLTENVEIGAFVNGECRGSAKLMYVEPLDQYIAFLTVYGNEDETVSFNVYNEGNLYNADEYVVFANDAVIGKAVDPFVLHISGNNSLSLYPNPVNKGERITVELNGRVDLNGATMQIYNALGSLIRTENFTQSAKTIEALQNSGIYTVKVTDAQGNVYVGKLVVK